jgi:transcriptional regulator with XRE-family HTH domain
MSDTPFGHRFREARKKKKLTQAAVAERLHVSQSAVAQWETGHSYPSEGMARRIKQLLGVDYQAADRSLAVFAERPSRSRLPIIGIALPGDDERVLVDDVPHGEILAPPQLERIPGAKAVYVRGHTMEPRYFAGEVVYLDPNRRPNRGDFVFLTIHEPGFTGKVGYVRQYIGEDLVSLRVSTLNPKKEEVIDATNVVELATIVGSGLF